MDKLPDDVRAFFQGTGRKGGQHTKEKHGTKHFSNAGKLGMAKRWANHKKKA